MPRSELPRVNVPRLINNYLFERRINMGAIVVSIYVVVIGIVGVIYFEIQDRKDRKRKED